MDPNSSPWAYAYNRIVPSASGSSDDFQHQHLASISAAAGSSAQSLLLQAAHTSIAGFNATSGNFVPPSPIGSYNPVFQQIYHHAAQAAVQPKPAHYASSAVNTPHRQIGIVEKHDNCRSQPTTGYALNQAINIPTSNYYGENSSSSGASPSPTTSSAASTTLSWNTHVLGASQQMAANAFLTMQQHQQQVQQQQQQELNQEKVANSKHANINTKAQSKSYGELVYVENNEQQHNEVTIQLDNQNIQQDCNRADEGFYTFVDGKLTYNIPAAAISSVASLTNKLPVRVVSPRKPNSCESQQSSSLQQNLIQIPSPAYPVYESPSLCSSVGSPPPAGHTMHNNETTNNSSHINAYKSNTPTHQHQQAQTSLDSAIGERGANTKSNRNNNYLRNGLTNSSPLTATGVAYSSVITSALQAQQQQQQQSHPTHQQSLHTGGWLSNSVDNLSDISKSNQTVLENTLYHLPPSLQIRHILEPAIQHQPHVMNDALRSQTNDKQQAQSHHMAQAKQPSAENASTASQIQSTIKVEEAPKPTPPKKTPRKRQPKKNLLNNDFARQQANAQASRQQQEQQQQIHHQPQHQQTVQLQQQNGSFYDYNNRWMTAKIENNADVSAFGNNQQQQQANPLPQPAHAQTSQTHPHISQISQYYPAFPQQVSTQYAACMNQNNTLYNLNQISHEAAQQQHQQQSHSSMQQQNPCIEAQPESAAESSTYKVIVPNIEDELHFLSTADPKAAQQSNNAYGRNQQKAAMQNQIKPETAKPTPTFRAASPGKKFMDSYLKFLQGEREDSPPPMVKSGRKYNYHRPAAPANSATNKRKSSSDADKLPTTTPAAESSSSSVQTPVAPVADTERTAIGPDDGHKIKIISQTQILPKKRPQAQNLAATIQSIHPTPQQQQQQHLHQSQQPQQQLGHLQFRHNQHQSFHQDPLALPPRREQSLRKAKTRSIKEIMQTTPQATDRDEPEEFADSDADPVWEPQDDDSDDARHGKPGNKRKIRRKVAPLSSKKREVSCVNNTAIENDETKKLSSVADAANTSASSVSATDNFKTGDFIVLRSDLVNDWPIIWQVDSKCILQKYEPFCQNGKMFYRNMSKYASWNLETKKLYLKAPVRIQVQSHTETIVEFMRSELLADDTEQFIEKIMEDYLTYRDHFEIYIQTMISQVLDPSFFSEINREKDEYFLTSVRTIDEIMENCKRKLLSITPWTRSVIMSIETWPQCHVFTEWGQNNVNQKNCGGCHQPGISVRFLLFGHPYNTSTMQTIPVDVRVSYEKDILLCRICAARADIFHKIAHEKYNLFAICTTRVGEQQKEFPDKGSTEILNDLLAENNWVDELFRNMRSSWAEVESLERHKRFHEVSP